MTEKPAVIQEALQVLKDPETNLSVFRATARELARVARQAVPFTSNTIALELEKIICNPKIREDFRADTIEVLGLIATPVVEGILIRVSRDEKLMAGAIGHNIVMGLKRFYSPATENALLQIVRNPYSVDNDIRHLAAEVLYTHLINRIENPPPDDLRAGNPLFRSPLPPANDPE